MVPVAGSWWQAIRQDIREQRGLIYGVSALVIGGIIVAGIVAGALESEDKPRPKSPPRPTPTAKPTKMEKDLACLKDVECAADKSGWGFDAERKCKPLVERLAKYTARWTDGWLESGFDTVRLQPPDFKTLQYIGSKVEFQNGFGAWQRMHYTCVYDPINEEAKSVNVTAG